jgi:ribosomal-protein-alanine N-acetyltransferase
MNWGPGQEPTLELMRESDLDEVLAIEMACFSLPWPKSAFLLDLHSRDSCCIVARLGGKAVGYIIGLFVLDEVHINNIAVHVKHRRKGLGDKLLKSLLETAEERGSGRAILELRASNMAARKLYEKHGFQLVAVRKAYYRHPLEDALLMVLDFGARSGDDPPGLEVQDGVVSKG